MASICKSILLGRTFKALDFYDGTEDVNKYDVFIFHSKNLLEFFTMIEYYSNSYLIYCSSTTKWQHQQRNKTD